MGKNTTLVCSLVTIFLLMIWSDPAMCQDVQFKPYRVLFIGNSYTASNGMPRTMESLGRSLGFNLAVTARTIGGVGLDVHLRNARTHQAIASGPWDAVVLQDFSLTPGLPLKIVNDVGLPAVVEIVRLIRATSPKARIIYYETWGRREGDLRNCAWSPEVCTFHGHTAALQRGYALYRRMTGGEIAPVGSVWQRVTHDSLRWRPFDRDALWVRRRDGRYDKHPSRIGSYLSAAVILRTIAGHSLEAGKYLPGLDPTSAYLLQAADRSL